MQLITRVIIAALLLFSTLAQAREVTGDLPSSARIGIDLYYMTQASYDRDDRLAYTIGYNWAILPYLRLDNSFTYAPDENSSVTDVHFSEDLYLLAPTIAVTYPLLFRFVVAAGPTYILTRSHVSFRGNSTSTQTSQFGGKLNANMEYAIADCCEIAATIGIVTRPHDAKMDWFYGIAYSHNIGPVSSASATRPSLPFFPSPGDNDGI